MPDDIRRQNEDEQSDNTDEGVERGIGEADEDDFDDDDELEEEEEDEDLDSPRGVADHRSVHDRQAGGGKGRSRH